MPDISMYYQNIFRVASLAQSGNTLSAADNGALRGCNFVE
jgi:hypothetical protein